MSDHDPRTPPVSGKTEARQGRIVGQGRIARRLVISLVLLVAAGVVLFFVF